MNDVMNYNGYWGSVEVSLSEEVIHGKILNINDLITYEAKTVEGLQEEFRLAVDDYLETCESLNREPNKPFSGTFNVRIGPEKHHELWAHAHLMGVSINEAIKLAVNNFLQDKQQKEIVKNHIVIIGEKGWPFRSTIEIPSHTCDFPGANYEIAFPH